MNAPMFRWAMIRMAASGWFHIREQEESSKMWNQYDVRPEVLLQQKIGLEAQPRGPEDCDDAMV
jgi:hypothetical protein